MILLFSADLHDVLVREHGGALGGGEAEVGQAHRGGQGEGDGEPDQAPRDEAPHSLTLHSDSSEQGQCRDVYTSSIKEL